jgi:hypothetical protein
MGLVPERILPLKRKHRSVPVAVAPDWLVTMANRLKRQSERWMQA